MFSIAAALSYYNLRRLARMRRLAVGLIVLPAVAAAVCRFAGYGRVWMCAAACVVAVGVVTWLRHRSDNSSGLAAAINCAGLGPRGILISEAAAAAMVVVIQVGVMAITLSVLP